MKYLKYICGNCGTTQDILTTADRMFEICSFCQAMGEWSQPEVAEAEVLDPLESEEVEPEEPGSTVEEETEPTTDLILIEENTPLGDIWTAENVDAMIAKLEKYNKDFKGDVTTAKGRKAIISFSRKFSTGKVFVDGTAIELADEWQKKTKALNTQRRRFKDTCDRLRDESRKPVTDYENAEKLVIANQHQTLARLVDLYNAAGDLDVAVFESYIAEVNAIEIIGDADSEYYERGTREKDQTLTSLNQKLTARIQFNKDQAELARLREGAEKREAEEAKQKAAKDAKETEKKIKLRAKEEATKKAAKKIADAKEAEETAKAEKIEAEKKAEREKVEAAAKAKKDQEEAVAAEKKKAAENERRRLAKVEEDQKADEVRAADKENLARINKEIVEFLSGYTTVTIANKISGDMIKGECPNVKVEF